MPSNTYRLDTAVKFLKGVGPRLGAVFQNHGIETLQDLNTFFPRAYEDRSAYKTVDQIQPGETATLKLTTSSVSLRPLRNGRKIFEVRAKDDKNQWISLKWFRTFPGFEKKFPPGSQFIASGATKGFQNQLEIIHPDIQFTVEDTAHAGRVIPIYREIEGISSKVIRNLITAALDFTAEQIPEDLPNAYLTKHQFPKKSQAVREVHFPEKMESDGFRADFQSFRSPAHLRLIYEEFFKFEYFVLKQRMNVEKEKGNAFDRAQTKKSYAEGLKGLPFKLTAGQLKVLEEIFDDFSKPHPMNRLLQADVGAGKTVVALLAAKVAIDQGFQVALMAPTEILAEQHVRNALKYFGADFPMAVLLGKTKAAERKKLLPRLESGEPLLLIGTHALIEDPVHFKKLGLVVIDEQHRFGVDQRRKLRSKAVISPHTLVMTATPIPRTLALTAYGDLATSTISERPPGRTPIKTHLIRNADRPRMEEFIRKEVRKGRQAYIILPLVNESESEKFTHLKNAIAESERLAKDVFQEFKIGLLHGQLSSDEKAEIMDRFRKNEVQILVSTTVVEVGVDVANATVMLIEHAERFGLSQLHQLRGRIGRGEHASTCFLMTSHAGFVPTPERLEVMTETEDGFKIAEADLELRGPGEFLGTRQAGALPFKLANLVRDQEWLTKARDDVLEILKADPEVRAPGNANFRRYLDVEGKVLAARLQSS